LPFSFVVDDGCKFDTNGVCQTCESTLRAPELTPIRHQQLLEFVRDQIVAQSPRGGRNALAKLDAVIESSDISVVVDVLNVAHNPRYSAARVHGNWGGKWQSHRVKAVMDFYKVRNRWANVKRAF
jgi:hypothetical protein